MNVKTIQQLMEEARHLIREIKKAYIAADFQGATGSTVKPDAVVPQEK
jgi:hypothetical protein